MQTLPTSHTRHCQFAAPLAKQRQLSRLPGLQAQLSAQRRRHKAPRARRACIVRAAEDGAEGLELGLVSLHNLDQLLVPYCAMTVSLGGEKLTVLQAIALEQVSQSARMLFAVNAGASQTQITSRSDGHILSEDGAASVQGRSG